MATDWVKLVGIKVVKIFAFIIIALFATITIVGLTTNKRIKVWVFEFNIRDTAFKYVTNTAHDTIRVPVYIKSEAQPKKDKPEVSQKNKYGDNNQSTVSGNGNHNVTGNGNSIGVNGDVNIGLIQRHLNDQMKVKLLGRVNDTLARNGLPKSTEISLGFTMGNEEAMNFATEVATFLFNNGYNINRNIGPTIGNEGKGFWIKINEKNMFIDVGVASHNGYP